MAIPEKYGRRPDWRLGVQAVGTKRRGIIGYGWTDEDGSIAIKLCPCVVLTGESEVYVRLFPRTGHDDGDTDT